MKTAENILSECLQTFKPSLIICSYSGGYDSMVATHKTIRWAKHHAHSTNILTIAVDTKIHAEGWPEFVTQSARSLQARRFEIWETTMLEKWKQDVESRGFAYRKAQHKIYFYYLKQNAFRAALAHYKKHRFDRIMFITGVRRSESKERADTPEFTRNGASVWCNPLVNWSESDIHNYRLEHELPESPFYRLTGNSGDCLCNWHMNIPLENVTGEAAEIIKPLDTLCRAKFGYGYGEEPSKLKAQELAGQIALPGFDDMPYLCAGCEKPKAKPDQVDNLIMQRMEW